MAKRKSQVLSFLALNVAAKRKAAGLTQPALADKVGVHKNVIGKIEGEHGEGEAETRQLIADFFKCSVADLYQDPNRRFTSNEMNAAASFLSKFVGLPPALQEFVWAVVQQEPELYGAFPADFQKVLKRILKES